MTGVLFAFAVLYTVLFTFDVYVLFANSRP